MNPNRSLSSRGGPISIDEFSWGKIKDNAIPASLRVPRFAVHPTARHVPLVCKTCRFETQRLAVEEWHSSSLDLVDVVRNMLTARVMQALPEAWRGDYTPERARTWIEERDRAGATLLAVERSSGEPVALMILFEEDVESQGGPTVRLGYLLAESAWGQGLASELVRGFVHWCRKAGVRSIVGGVERGNVASQRVLEKSGFVCDPDTEDADEQMFELRLDRKGG